MVARVARIRYEELQVVTDELPENLSCVDIQGLCRPTHYTGQSVQDWETGLLGNPVSGKGHFRKLQHKERAGTVSGTVV